ncbi:hypothetical protein ACSSS7_003384 [Eimeria intestinalis]
MQVEEGRCTSSANNSTSSSRLQAFAAGAVMQQLAAYMRERCILGPEQKAPHKSTTQGASEHSAKGFSQLAPQGPLPERQRPLQGLREESGPRSDGPSATAHSRAATSPLSSTATASAPDSSSSGSSSSSCGKGGSKGGGLASSVNSSRPRLRVCLQPEVGEDSEMSPEMSGGGVRTAQEDGGDESDGGEALKSKTAAFGFLYDDAMDELDSAWVRKTLRLGEGHTDAVLSCAGCFTPVCYQCQRQVVLLLLFLWASLLLSLLLLMLLLLLLLLPLRLYPS